MMLRIVVELEAVMGFSGLRRHRHVTSLDRRYVQSDRPIITEIVTLRLCDFEKLIKITLKPI